MDFNEVIYKKHMESDKTLCGWKDSHTQMIDTESIASSLHSVEHYLSPLIKTNHIKWPMLSQGRKNMSLGEFLH